LKGLHISVCKPFLWACFGFVATRDETLNIDTTRLVLIGQAPLQFTSWSFELIVENQWAYLATKSECFYWTLPGVVTGGRAQVLLKSQRVQPGGQVVNGG